MTRRARVRLGRRDDDSTARPRRDAIERSHDAVRRSRPVDASGERARVSPRSLEIIHGWTASTSRPRLARSRRRSPDRVVARTRRRRVSPARDARASGRLGARREGGAREERERDGTARANDARGRGSASATSRDANFFCARRVTRPAAARDDRRAGTDGRAARTRTRMCDFELIRSIAIVRRARRCASPPRARL